MQIIRGLCILTKLSLRAILHDDARYPNPEVFDPSRFLTAEGRINPDVLDPAEAFGYGRRVCPGRYFALDAMWAAAAHILAVFEICKPLDGEGNFKDPSEGYGPGIFRCVHYYHPKLVATYDQYQQFSASI